MESKSTSPVRIALGWVHDPWRRGPAIELRDGKITFLPGKSMRDVFPAAEAAFPAGSRLEYRIETGDRYIDGDRGQVLGRSLWVIEPDGTKELLVRGFTIYVQPDVAASNLKRAGIPFRVLKTYDGPNGQHIETDVAVTVARSRLQFRVALILGTSSLWLGALAGFFIRDIGAVVVVGVAAFVALAVAAICTGFSKRTTLINLVAALPTYAAGYALAVVCVRHVVGR